MPDIDQLSIRINTEASQASAGLNGLITTLSKLHEAVQGENRGLNNIAKGLQNISSAVSKFDATKIYALKRFITGLEGLQKASNIEISKDISRRISSIGKAVNNVTDEQISKLERLGTALANMSGATSGGLKDIADALKTINANNNALLHWGAGGDGSNKLTLAGVVSGFKNIINDLRALRVGFGFVRSAIDVSNEYIEDLNLYSVSMGEYAEAGYDFAQKVGDLMGIDPGEFMKYQGTFMTIAQGLGVASDRASIMSQNMTQLGYDLSSLYNVSFATAMERLQSGLTGQIKGMRKFGYDLSDVALSQAALELGITKTTDAMSQAEKAELRYYLMMTNVTWAQNDMARTLEAPSNQLRLFKAQLTQVVRAIGNLFIPILNAVLPILTAIANVLKSIINTIASLFGVSLPDIDYSSVSYGVEDATGGIADNLGNAASNAKKMKDYLLSIDELNVLNPDTGAGAGGGAGGGAGAGGTGGSLGFDLPTYDFFNGLIESKASRIADKMKEWLELDKIKSWGDLWETNLGKVLETVIGISSAMAGWKIFTAFGADGVLGLTLGLSIAGFTMMAKNGVDPTNSILTLIGTSLFGARAGWKIATGMAAAGKSFGMGGGLFAASGMSAGAWGAMLGTFYVAIGVVGVIQMMYAYQHPDSDWGRHFTTVGLAPTYETDAWGYLMYGDDYKRMAPTVDELTQKLVDLQKPEVTKALSGLTGAFGNMRTTVVSVQDAVSKVGSEIESGADVANKFGSSWDTTMSGIAAGFIGLGEDEIPKLYDKMTGQNDANKVVSFWKNNIVKPIGGAFTTLTSTVSNALSSATSGGIRGLSDTWNGFVTSVGTAVNSVIGGINTVAPEVLKTWKDMFRQLGFTDQQIHGIGSGAAPKWEYANALISMYSAPSQSDPSYNKKNPNMLTKAAGGFVGSGQVFIAREAGAELVGAIGNRTAVANNDQIVEAVSTGVYDAVVAAMGGASNNDAPIVITLDGDVIYRSNQKIARNKGYNLGMGAFA